MLVALVAGFRDRRGQVALVDDRVAERSDPLAETGNAERGRPHVDAAPAAAEVERHADHMNRFHRTFTEIEIPSPDGATMDVRTTALF